MQSELHCRVARKHVTTVTRPHYGFVVKHVYCVILIEFLCFIDCLICGVRL